MILGCREFGNSRVREFEISGVRDRGGLFLDAGHWNLDFRRSTLDSGRCVHCTSLNNERLFLPLRYEDELRGMERGFCEFGSARFCDFEVMDNLEIRFYELG